MKALEQKHLELFAFEIQDAFEGLVGCPILLTIQFNDIYRTKDGKRHLICSLADQPPCSADLTEEWQHTHFVLDVTQETAQFMADGVHNHHHIDTFAVVAVPARIDLSSATSSSRMKIVPGEGDYALTREVWIRGRLVDAECLPDLYTP